MWTWARRYYRRQPGRDLVLLFALTVLFPSLVLGVLAVRTMVREQALADEQIRARLDGLAERAGRQLDRELDLWRTSLMRASRAGSLDVASLPAWMPRAAKEAGVLAVIVATPDGRRVWPESALAYRPWPDATPERDVGAGLAGAELLELRDHDYPRALRRYQTLASTVAPDDRATLLLRTAITLRKNGAWSDSLATLRSLVALPPGRIGGVPSDLVARAEICDQYAAQGPAAALTAAALDLERDLVDGRWTIEEPRYLDYVARVREWTSIRMDPATGHERERLAAKDASKRALAEAAATLTNTEPLAARGATSATLSAGPGPTQFVAAWTAEAPDRHAGAAALLVSSDWLTAHLWPDVLASVAEPGFEIAVLTAPSSSAPSPHVGTRSLQGMGPSWRIETRPRDVAALSASLARSRGTWIAVFGLTLALLGFGTYLTLRVVRRESEIVRMKSDFVSAVSHEFRSPLTGIRQLGEMLMRGRVPSDAKRQEYYERIAREADRLSRVVENLLDFARMEEGRKAYALEPIDTSAWLDGVVEEFRPLAAANRHAIAADIPRALPPVLADREALACAVHNLLDNAVKYSPNAEAVWLNAGTAHGHVTIQVRDRGAGIADADRPHLFDRFYRGSTEAARQASGVGLGLSLTRHIVAAHGGRIEFTSAPGEGSTFSIHLNVDRRPAV